MCLGQRGCTEEEDVGKTTVWNVREINFTEVKKTKDQTNILRIM